jgi:pyruvate/2-oxoglutarate dehydrogenase complex dihydrolipoamide acyltransferase (E2) component
MQGTIVSLSVKEGDAVAAGQPLLIMDAMKMQHEIKSPARGYVRRIAVEAGETIYEGHALLFVEEADVEVKGAAVEEKIDLDYIRPDLAEYFERRAHDARRQAARGRGAAAQDQPAHGAAESRRPGRSRLVRRIRRLRHRQPAHAPHHRRPDREDAGRRADHRHRPVNGSLFGPTSRASRVAHYDYTVLAGTQGKTNHHKKDRLFEIVEEQRIPLVFFTEAAAGGRATSTCSRSPASTPWPSISSDG